MNKIDYKKELKSLYQPSAKEITIIEVPKMNFLQIDGQGDPNHLQDFQDAVEALYGLSYTLKFMIKKGELGTDYTVMPLEGLWWTEDMNNFSVDDKGNWEWTLMIMQPEFITVELFEEGLKQIKKKKNLTALDKIRFESYDEGPAAQIMHIGPFSEEGPTVAMMHQFIKENGYELSGKHHEIYLSDPRKAAPEKMKTILRQPLRAVLY